MRKKQKCPYCKTKISSLESHLKDTTNEACMTAHRKVTAARILFVMRITGRLK